MNAERKKLLTLHLPLEMGFTVDVLQAVAKHYGEVPVADIFGGQPDGDLEIWSAPAPVVTEAPR